MVEANTLIYIIYKIYFCSYYYFDPEVHKLLHVTVALKINSNYRALTTTIDVQQQEMLLPICLWEVRRAQQVT